MKYIQVAQKCSDFNTMQFSWSDIAFCIPAQSGGGWSRGQKLVYEYA